MYVYSIYSFPDNKFDTSELLSLSSYLSYNKYVLNQATRHKIQKTVHLFVHPK